MVVFFVTMERVNVGSVLLGGMLVCPMVGKNDHEAHLVVFQLLGGAPPPEGPPAAAGREPAASSAKGLAADGMPAAISAE